MTTMGQRIKRARVNRGLTQLALAERFGISRVSVTQWEADTTRPDPDKLPKLLEILGGDAEYYLTGEGNAPSRVPMNNTSILTKALEEKDERIAVIADAMQSVLPNASPPVPITFPTSRIPIYGQAVGGEDGRFVLNGQRVADLLCPPQLHGVPNAYGVFVHGESMEPRYYAGEALFLNPALPVRRGDFVVVQIAGESEADDAAGYVKRFISMNSKELVLEQFKAREDVPDDAPEAERFTMRFPRSKVVAVHKIVGTANG